MRLFLIILAGLALGALVGFTLTPLLGNGLTFLVAVALAIGYGLLAHRMLQQQSRSRRLPGER
jgi:hypothetical protein